MKYCELQQQKSKTEIESPFNYEPIITDQEHHFIYGNKRSSHPIQLYLDEESQQTLDNDINEAKMLAFKIDLKNNHEFVERISKSKVCFTGVMHMSYEKQDIIPAPPLLFNKLEQYKHFYKRLFPSCYSIPYPKFMAQQLQQSSKHFFVDKCIAIKIASNCDVLSVIRLARLNKWWYNVVYENMTTYWEKAFKRTSNIIDVVIKSNVNEIDDKCDLLNFQDNDLAINKVIHIYKTIEAVTQKKKI